MVRVGVGVGSQTVGLHAFARATGAHKHTGEG